MDLKIRSNLLLLEHSLAGGCTLCNSSDEVRLLFLGSFLNLLLQVQALRNSSTPTDAGLCVKSFLHPRSHEQKVMLTPFLELAKEGEKRSPQWPIYWCLPGGVIIPRCQSELMLSEAVCILGDRSCHVAVYDNPRVGFKPLLQAILWTPFFTSLLDFSPICTCLSHAKTVAALITISQTRNTCAARCSRAPWIPEVFAESKMMWLWEWTLVNRTFSIVCCEIRNI